MQRAEERKVAIAVRAHPTIELLEDRLYVVSCGRAGFQNSRNEVSVVMLKVSLPSDHERKVTTVVEGRQYNLRAEVLDHDRESSKLYRMTRYIYKWMANAIFAVHGIYREVFPKSWTQRGKE